jgi:DNA adenine methylase
VPARDQHAAATPHPIPYQGSKRRIAAQILACFPRRVERLLDPCAGSGAVTLAAARQGRAERYLMGEALVPLARLWQGILAHPEALAKRYAALWTAAASDPRAHYDRVRAEFNVDQEPAKLLYLLARCVKNAVRFNGTGEFNQSPDRRRLGMHPRKMQAELGGAHRLLRGRTEMVAGDLAELCDRATARDLVYLDPPYQGTSGRRDRRYVAPLDLPEFVGVLERLRMRGVRFLVSLDGRSGDRTYGRALPRELGLVRLELFAGRSSQATLHGRAADTVESLYLSPELA